MGTSRDLERTITLRDWILRLLAGERRARRWLYETFSGALLRKLRQRYSHLESVEVEDLLHDAFLFFFRRSESLFRRFVDEPDSKPLSIAQLDRFLWDQACGIAANQRRANSARPKLVDITQTRPQEAPSTEAHLLDRDQCQRIAEALRRGDARVYLYFKLRFVEGLTPREICHVLGWPKNEVYNLRIRLERAVQDHLNENNP